LLGFDGTLESVTIQGNTIGVPAGATNFTRGIWTRELSATIGGATPALGNSIFGTFQDVLFQFGGLTSLLQNNTLTGAGIDITEPAPGASVINIIQNSFLPVSPA